VLIAGMERLRRPFAALHAWLSRRPELETWSLRDEWPWPVAVAVGLFLFYAWCSPRTIALEDDGLFVMASYFNGIAHPPGYPVFTLIGHLFSQLPFGSVAWRVHLVSALFGGLTCAVIWCIARSLVPSRAIATVSALAFGFSEAFWSQAIIAEVYTLNTFITFLIVLMLVEITRARSKSESSSSDDLGWRDAILLGLVYGLGLSNHWPLLLLFSPAYLLIVWPVIRPLLRRSIALFLGLGLGLVPYLWLYLRSQMEPEISFFGQLEGWSQFFEFVSRSNYSTVDQEPGVGWSDKVGYLKLLAGTFVNQLTAVGFCLGILGFLVASHQLRLIVIGLLLGAIGVSFLLIFLLDREYALLGILVFRVYPIPAYGVLAILLAFALYRIRKWIDCHPRIALKSTLGSAIAALVIALPFIAHVGNNHRANYSWAERYAKTALDELPMGAQLLLRSDVEAFVIGYVNLIQGYRDDVTVYATGGRVFRKTGWLPEKSDDDIDLEVVSWEARNDDLRNFCFVGIDKPSSAVKSGVVWNGLTSCYAISTEKNKATLGLTSASLSRLGALQEAQTRDRWTLLSIDLMNAQLLPVLLNAKEHGVRKGGGANHEVERTIEKALRGVLAKLAYLDIALGDSLVLPNRALKPILQQALAQLDDAPYKNDMIRAYLLLSKIYSREERHAESESVLWRAVRFKPVLENLALPMLTTRLFESRRDDEIRNLASLSPDLRVIANLYSLYVAPEHRLLESIEIRKAGLSISVDRAGRVSINK
jgi:hypothetical protein